MLEPQVQERATGGWLARAAEDDPLGIAVVADSEDQARKQFAAEHAAWERLLANDGGNPRTQQARIHDD